jgi:hypothetical protein
MGGRSLVLSIAFAGRTRKATSLTDSTRELRYYSSNSKLLLQLVGSLTFVFIGWLIKGSAVGFNLVMAWLAIVLFGLGVVVFFVQLLLAVVVRKPVLRINTAGIASAAPLQLSKTSFVPWDDIARINVRVQSASSRNKQYYFLVEPRHPERYTTLNKQNLSAQMYPSLAHAAISVIIGQLFFIASRKRRTQLLERIETTFAPEITQFNIVVDNVERPL